MEHHEVSVPRSDSHLDLELPKARDFSDQDNKHLHLSSGPICSFSKLEETILDSEQRSKSAVKLIGLMLFYLIVMALEVIGGLKANSLAVLTDAVHLLTDIAGFSVALFSVWVSGWEANSKQSFGFHRIEVLGALLSLQFIWVVSGFLTYEAFDRILQKRDTVNGELMFGIAAFGFVINFIMVVWLGHVHGHGHSHIHHTCTDNDHHHENLELASHGLGHGCFGNFSHESMERNHRHEDEEEQSISLVSSAHEQKNRRPININIEGAYLHVMADMIQSVGVMIAGLVIWAKPEFLVVDLICTMVFSLFALMTTLPMLRSIISILMERAPSEVDVELLRRDLKNIKGLHEVNDLHVWAITSGKFVLACHVIVKAEADSRAIIQKVRDLCRETYRIQHVTVQIEHEL